MFAVFVIVLASVFENCCAAKVAYSLFGDWRRCGMQSCGAIIGGIRA